MGEEQQAGPGDGIFAETVVNLVETFSSCCCWGVVVAKRLPCCQIPAFRRWVAETPISLMRPRLRSKLCNRSVAVW